MIQCKSHLTGEKKCTRPNRVFHVNGTTVVRSKFITNLYLWNSIQCNLFRGGIIICG